MQKSQYLEVTVLSAEDLRIGSRSVSKNAYVVVHMGAIDAKSTSLDRDGGSYPHWNETLHLALPAALSTSASSSSSSAASLTVEVRCKSGVGDRMVGTASIPMSDIMADYVPAHLVHFLSYRLRERDGDKNGIVNLAVKMVGLAGNFASQLWTMPMPVPKPIPMSTTMSTAGPRFFAGRNDGSAVAIGVPVSSYNY